MKTIVHHIKRGSTRWVAAAAIVFASCKADAPTAAQLPDNNASIAAAYALVSENDNPLPEDPWAPYGCCATLSGSLALTASTYDLRTSHKNLNNGLLFSNSEQGTYTRDGSVLHFTRVSGGGEGYPYLLAPGAVSVDGGTITLLYGDEGPGSNQARAVFKR